MIGRVNGLLRHSASLHEWHQRASIATQEDDIAVMLFCMDSAVECFVFMLNALGQAADKSAFRSVSSDRDLRRIGPDDILGSKRDSLVGYARYFPRLQALWQSHSGLLKLIFENHDVTKHRHQATVSGKCRTDPPKGFYESLGLPADPIVRAINGPASPMAEVWMANEPKLPYDETRSSTEACATLETTEKQFLDFVSKSFCLALGDAKQTIPLNGPIVRQGHNQTKLGRVVGVTPRSITVQLISGEAEAGESS